MTSRFLKFCVVGFSGVFVNMAVFSAANNMGCYYITASILSFLVAVSNNFFWNSMWTFKDRQATAGDIHRRYVKFFTISALCLLGNLGLLFFLVEKVGLAHIFSQATAILVMSAANFIGQNLFTFEEKKEEKPVSAS